MGGVFERDVSPIVTETAEQPCDNRNFNPGESKLVSGQFRSPLQTARNRESEQLEFRPRNAACSGVPADSALN